MVNSLLVYQPPIDYPLVTGTIIPVITVAEAKQALRIDASYTGDDLFIERLIFSATDYFEKQTGRDLINKTYKCFLDAFPACGGVTNYFRYGVASALYDNGIKILKSKLQSITSIQYYLDNVLTTWDPANYYPTDETDFASIYLVNTSNWPERVDNRKQAVKILLVAGFGPDASYVPTSIKMAITQMVVDLYENRGDCTDCSCNGSKLYAATQGLLTSWRIMDV